MSISNARISIIFSVCSEFSRSKKKGVNACWAITLSQRSKKNSGSSRWMRSACRKCNDKFNNLSAIDNWISNKRGKKGNEGASMLISIPFVYLSFASSSISPGEQFRIYGIEMKCSRIDFAMERWKSNDLLRLLFCECIKLRWEFIAINDAS